MNILDPTFFSKTIWLSDKTWKADKVKFSGLLFTAKNKKKINR